MSHENVVATHGGVWKLCGVHLARSPQQASLNSRDLKRSHSCRPSSQSNTCMPTANPCSLYTFFTSSSVDIRQMHSSHIHVFTLELLRIKTVSFRSRPIECASMFLAQRVF